MGIVRKQSILNTLSSYLGVVLGFINVVIIYPIVLDPSQFGLTRLALSFSMIVAQLSALGTSRSIIKFKSGDKKEKDNILIQVLVILIVGVVISGFVLIFFKDLIIQRFSSDNDLFAHYYFSIYLLIAGIILFNFSEAILISYKQTVKSNLTRNIYLRIYWMLIVILLYLDVVGFDAFFTLYNISYLIFAFLLIVQIIWIDKSLFSYKPIGIDFKRFKEVFVYSFTSIIEGASAILVTNIDIVMLGMLLTESNLELIGYYAIATYIANVIHIPSKAMFRIIMPLISDFLHRKEVGEIAKLYKNSSTILFYLGSLLSGLILLNFKTASELLKPEYQVISITIVFLILTKLFDMMIGVNNIILTLSDLYKKGAILSFLLILLAVLSNYFLIPIYEINGAALATMVVYLFYNIISVIIIYNGYKIHPFSYSTLKVLLIIAISFSISIFIQLDNQVLEMLVRSVSFVLLFGIMTFILRINIISEQISKFKKTTLSEVITGKL